MNLAPFTVCIHFEKKFSTLDESIKYLKSMEEFLEDKKLGYILDINSKVIKKEKI